jgi:hypothetical protein
MSIGLKVELPMFVEMDNSGARDLANSWSVDGGRIRHVDVCMFFLRELKEDGLLSFKHVSGTENESGIFTKNVCINMQPNFVGKTTCMNCLRSVEAKEGCRSLRYKTYSNG